MQTLMMQSKDGNLNTTEFCFNFIVNLFCESLITAAILNDKNCGANIDGRDLTILPEDYIEIVMDSISFGVVSFNAFFKAFRERHMPLNNEHFTADYKSFTTNIHAANCHPLGRNSTPDGAIVVSGDRTLITTWFTNYNILKEMSFFNPTTGKILTRQEIASALNLFNEISPYGLDRKNKSNTPTV